MSTHSIKPMHSVPRVTAPSRASEQAGFTALELAFSVAIFVVVLLSSLAMVQRDTSLARSTLGIGTVENLAQEMLFSLERELSNARGESPTAVLTANLAAGATDSLVIDSTLGFPDEGVVVVDPGQATEERIAYNGFNAGQSRLLNLERNFGGCGGAFDHTVAGESEVMWEGLAVVLDQQWPPPAAGDFNGQVAEPRGTLYYRGRGTGFSYRVPVDPADPVNGTNYLNGDDLWWGSVLGAGDDPTQCWSALYFEAKTTIAEAATGDDLNRDGDTNDVFDIGQIRRRTWSAWNPAAASESVGLGPSSVIQEQCNYGGDLDGDGLDDPIFLWDGATRQLHVRVAVVGNAVANMPLVRMVDSVIFLRNEPVSP